MKNKIFKTLVLVAVSIILIKNIDVFKKTYFLLTKNYDQRFIDAYNRYYFSGFCSKQAHGYIRYIKTKYKNKISPKIINLEKSRRIRWFGIDRLAKQGGTWDGQPSQRMYRCT